MAAILSLKFVPRGPINNILALVQIMAWCLPGDKPLSESMMVSLLTYICVTRPQRVNAITHYTFYLFLFKTPFHFPFPRSPEITFDGHFECLLNWEIDCICCRILISISKNIEYNYYVMISSSITPHCHLENAQIFAQEQLLTSRVLISCSHSSFFCHHAIFAVERYVRLLCYTVKPVCNDHLHYKIHYQWLIQ